MASNLIAMASNIVATASTLMFDIDNWPCWIVLTLWLRGGTRSAPSALNHIMIHVQARWAMSNSRGQWFDMLRDSGLWLRLWDCDGMQNSSLIMGCPLFAARCLFLFFNLQPQLQNHKWSIEPQRGGEKPKTIHLSSKKDSWKKKVTARFCNLLAIIWAVTFLALVPECHEYIWFIWIPFQVSTMIPQK